jgi:PAS domain S-box-containing protein
MARARIVPTGRESFLDLEEIIVSKTDLKGRITYANDVFLRVARMTEAEVIGAPHNIIRHPEMPRAVFQLLWERIESGHECFAYVLNMAKNGDHYWVFAHVTPSRDAKGTITGYHSNRRKPDPGQIAAVAPLYKTCSRSSPPMRTARAAWRARAPPSTSHSRASPMMNSSSPSSALAAVAVALASTLVLALASALSTPGTVTLMAMLAVTGIACAFAAGVLVRHRRTLHAIAGVCTRAAEGDMEARIVGLEASGDTHRLAIAINRQLDISDAFLREATAAMEHARDARFYRRLILRGLPGAFRAGATAANGATPRWRRRSSPAAGSPMPSNRSCAASSARSLPPRPTCARPPRASPPRRTTPTTAPRPSPAPRIRRRRTSRRSLPRPKSSRHR